MRHRTNSRKSEKHGGFAFGAAAVADTMRRMGGDEVPGTNADGI